MQLAFIPSPSQGVWHIGPLPLRAYAMMIIIGVVVAVWLGERRWIAKGGQPGVVIDVAVWAVPFGLVGGRLYHVITDHQMYFGEGKHPLDALKVWNGGLGIWGAVALGAVGAWIGCRSKGVRLAPFADAVAPGIALAQGIGRWGNWWNQELYGKPTTLPWGVEIDLAHRPKDGLGGILPQYENVETYHPTFLYESIWCIALALVVIWAGKRYNLNHGRSFALYVAGYTVGRGWIEALRIDEAHHFLGLRLNDYTSIIVFLGAALYLYLKRNSGSVPEPLYFGDSAETEELVPVGAGATGAAEEGTGETVTDKAVASAGPVAAPVVVPEPESGDAEPEDEALEDEALEDEAPAPVVAEEPDEPGDDDEEEPGDIEIAEAEEAGDVEPAPVESADEDEAEELAEIEDEGELPVELEEEPEPEPRAPAEPIVTEAEPVPEDVWWAKNDDDKNDDDKNDDDKNDDDKNDAKGEG
ncbi:prolipoprotein diacylglyceryl transferase [Actinocorallia longicatena]|uniref:Phosphatidylglycerol--prolipoprotein diacylglyceryl transferase n=1 Tax=Actinocorallia longicatena TaxID=111803 RepID=A0ABP6QIN9_9ACTN